MLAIFLFSFTHFLLIFLDFISFSQSIPIFLIAFIDNPTMHIQQSDKTFSLVSIFSNMQK